MIVSSTYDFMTFFLSDMSVMKWNYIKEKSIKQFSSLALKKWNETVYKYTSPYKSRICNNYAHPCKSGI